MTYFLIGPSQCAFGARQLLTFRSVKWSIAQQSRMTMASFLIEDPKYAFLKDLGLDKTNQGVYNGQWFGSGEVISLIFKFYNVKFVVFVDTNEYIKERRW